MSGKMTVKTDFRTRYAPTIRQAALSLAIRNVVFNVRVLSKVMGEGYPVTNNMRRVLNELVTEGALDSRLVPMIDGTIPRYYGAPGSLEQPPLPLIYESEKAL